MSSTPTQEGIGSSKGRSRRGWTVQEEGNLVLAFRDIITGGWKAPNGFRSGFLIQLENRLKEYMPSTDLKAEPNISSKYTSWKKLYHQISNALSYSGLNWNSSTFTIEAEPYEWDSFLQQYPNHACLRGKPFPLYDAWVEIYGKDRATGHNAMDWSAAAEHAPVDLTADGEDNNETSYHPTMPTGLADVEVNQENTKGSQHGPAPRVSDKRKRKRTGKASEEIVDAITTFCKESTDSLRDVANRLGAAKDTIKRQEEIFEAIGSLPLFITIQDHINVSNMLVNNEKQMNMFFGMPIAARAEMVKMAIEGKLRA